MKDYKKSIEFQKALNFLNDHPGVGYDNNFLSHNFNFYVIDVCKNGEYKEIYQNPEDVKIILYKDNSVFKQKYQEKYRGLYDKFSNGDDEEIDVPYKDIYGYEWEYDRTIFKGEFSWLKYRKNKDLIKYLKSKGTKDTEKVASYYLMHYDRFQGETVTADTYEDLIIKTAEVVKLYFGNFKCDDFLTDEEEKNHQEQWMIKFKDLNDGSGCSEMISNPDYIRIEDYELNLRWYEWFKTTDYYKEKWSNVK